MASLLLYCMTCAVTLCGVDVCVVVIFLLFNFLNGKEFLSVYMNSIQ